MARPVRKLPNFLLSAATLLAATALLAAPAPGQSEIPAPPGGGFDLPLDCPMWEVCSIQNYVDRDPGPGWADHTCGHLSYDGHRGTDFRIPTLIEMRQGVDVIAAADGEVIVAEDGIPDMLMQDTGPGKTARERNGNRVAIHHGGSWVTTYAHLKKGTVAVKVGDRVTRGQKLGLVGLSGNSDFPHVHFAVAYRNLVLDPFTGQEPTAACGGFRETLWSPAAEAQLSYRAGGLLSAGFIGRQITHREVMDGVAAARVMPANSQVLIFYAGAWGLKAGDLQTMTIIGPDGKVFLDKEMRIERNRATTSRWIGRKLRQRAWPEGTYRGIYRVERRVAGKKVIVIEAQREVEVR